MKFRTLRIGAIASSILTLAAAGQVQAEERDTSSKWDVAVGAGVGYSPKYEGSDEMEVMALPFVHVEWDERIFFSPGDGLGVRVYRSDDLNVSASVGYDMGRDESDSSHLRGLGDVDGAAVASLSAEYELGPVTPFVSVSQHLGGTDGLTAEAGVEARFPLAGMGLPFLASRPLSIQDEEGPGGPMVMFGVSTEWADDNYMSEYFGVTAVQSARSGLAQYTASSGFKSAGVELGFMYPFGESWAFNVTAEYSRLLEDAADSPIVKDENQFSVGSFISYQF